MNVSIGYIPNGHVLGLSKLARLADWMARGAILQESYTDQLAEYLYDTLPSDGSIVIVHARHMCMSARGIKTGARCVTSSVRGLFDTNPAARSEFMTIWRTLT